MTVHPNKRLASVSAVVGSPLYVGKIAIARERELNPTVSGAHHDVFLNCDSGTRDLEAFYIERHGDQRSPPRIHDISGRHVTRENTSLDKSLVLARATVQNSDAGVVERIADFIGHAEDDDLSTWQSVRPAMRTLSRTGIDRRDSLDRPAVRRDTVERNVSSGCKHNAIVTGPYTTPRILSLADSFGCAS